MCIRDRFWGAATVSVFAGQMYVGTGYRLMSEAFHRVMDGIAVEVERDYSDKPKFY